MTLFKVEYLRIVLLTQLSNEFNNRYITLYPEESVYMMKESLIRKIEWEIEWGLTKQYSIDQSKTLER